VKKTGESKVRQKGVMLRHPASSFGGLRLRRKRDLVTAFLLVYIFIRPMLFDVPVLQ
jgi:hypothetical protein